MIENRANTPEEKKEVLDEVLAVWLRHPELRLCQLLTIACTEERMFYIEDFILVEDVQKISDKLSAFNKGIKNE